MFHLHLHDDAPATARRRLAYSLAAGAATATVGSTAYAEVVWSGLRDLAIEQTKSQDLDVTGNGFGDITLKNYVFNNGNYQGLTVDYAPGKVVGFGNTPFHYYVSALTLGTLIDAAALAASPKFYGSLAYGAENPQAQFNNISNGLIGFSFPKPFPVPGSIYYGWLRVSINNQAGTFVLHEWAYENVAGTGILAGVLEVAGDYNHNGIVDAADYTVWRDSLGSVSDLDANGDNNGTSEGVIDAADYVVWKTNFGMGFELGSGSTSSAIPEPITLGLLASGSLGLMFLRRTRQGQNDGP